MPDDRRPVTRLFDAVFRFLLRPGVRRVRRWSFLVTVPAGLLVARALDLKISLGTGLGAGLALAALDLLALVVVGALGARLLGKERRDALLDLMMHPAARRAIRGEALVLSTPLRALARRLRPVTRRTEFSYHRGSNELGLALALLPAALAEAAAVHLLLPHEWLVPKIVLAALSLYGFLMLFGWALSSRVDRHRLEGGLLELRAGALYRASVPLRHVETVERASERVARGGLVRHGEAALLPSRGRVDVRLRLAEPVCVERPLGDPIPVRELWVAVDDPGGFAAAVEAAQGTSLVTTPERRRSALAWLAPADLFEAATA